MIKASTIYGHYEAVIDRQSAYEMLRDAQPAGTQDAGAQEVPADEPESSGGGWLGGLADLFGGGSSSGRSRGDSVATTAAKSAARAIGSQVGRQLVRGLLGSLLGGSSRRR